MKSDFWIRFWVIVGIALFILAFTFLSIWAGDRQRSLCRGQGGTPVVWNSQVQCVFPGAPLR